MANIINVNIEKIKELHSLSMSVKGTPQYTKYEVCREWKTHRGRWTFFRWGCVPVYLTGSYYLKKVRGCWWLYWEGEKCLPERCLICGDELLGFFGLLEEHRIVLRKGE